MIRGRLLLALLIVFSVGRTAWAASGSLIAGENRRIEGTITGDLVLARSDIELVGSVEGDIVAWGGALKLAPSARVSGTIVLVGTFYRRDPTALVHGAVFQWADLSEVVESLASSLPGESAQLVGRWRWGIRIGVVGVWILAAMAVILLAGNRLEATARGLRRHPLRAISGGLIVFVAALLLAWAAMLLPAGIAIAAVAVIGLAAVSAKVVGMAAIFLIVGRWLGQRIGPAVALASPTAIAIGALCLCAIRLLPQIGDPIWVALSLIGLGAALEQFVAPLAARVTTD